MKHILNSEEIEDGKAEGCLALLDNERYPVCNNENKWFSIILKHINVDDYMMYDLDENRVYTSQLHKTDHLYQLSGK